MKETGTAVKDNVSAALSAARGKAGDAQAVVADALDRTADAVRETSDSLLTPHHGSRRARHGSTGSTLADAADGAAHAMERLALWLRENEIADAPTSVMRQLRRRPRSTGFIAVGVAFFVGGALGFWSAGRHARAAPRRLGLW